MDGAAKALEEVDHFLEEKKSVQQKWIHTGIKGFDNLIVNGIPEGSNIIIAGGPGCGKTIFCLQTLYNLACQGNDCIYLSMEERPERLKSHMMSFGFDVKGRGYRSPGRRGH